ncbi:SDR family NAD(P)-dependent oxidoreductase [Burkholderia sp. Ac-20379]|uniref:SDR family NAD(P)-dependent oxidoreductase n=1 Tax=Burkholderia sp. Ac-20379 TaxID=2703900 RepID=UPI00197D36F9|nr:SDR family oxidoreductase [Burkholderia sp. Ac-20379]MBN3727160.1 SDR family oxidoreductase [Burkholderia sp. Ac-20379]
MNKQRKLAVVTGGASGIGEAAARRFARGGYRVVIADINETRGREVAADIGREHDGIDFLKLDVADESDVRRFAAALLERHGVPDALVNSGGILQNAVRLLEVDIAEIDRLYDINVRGTLLVSRALGAAMCEAGRGAIVNLCSLTTFRPSAQIGYAVGKAGLKMLTEVMAAEWGPSGVRVNAVAPGYTLTPAMQARIDSGERDPAVVLEKSALPRFVAPSEVGDTIFYLCSPEASAVTGAVLPVDCGWLVRSAYLAYASQPA